ncbi:hypothetical protein B0H66DRAFT_635009 [Apodospora peruviana]|uniref:DUF6314 domain-containing protein n=1 Tax=Apodospora peruviana TaxID=516989 RepID=A0AAE0MEW1_9PEZI|nr:hypothetical protein B0H66DRAFT_635009 [Apodospora peruviana]
MPKTVCIVGAGPSGLVAAKSFLHDSPEGTFDVTIFDAQTRIGGLWPSTKDDGVGLVHPHMIANQSKHTVQFSDLAWEDSDPEFPRAWQVGRYLDRFLHRYCKGAKLRLGRRIAKAEPLADSSAAGWQVESVTHDGDLEEHTFDYLLIASGFFGKPVIPTALASARTQVPVIHSSQYRDLASLVGSTNRNGGKMMVVGGQMSGVEVAGTIASHLSSAMHSPGPSPIPNPDKYSVHHLTQRPVWVFPLYTSPKPTSSAPPFIPSDLSSYNLANRPHPLTNTQGHVTVDAARNLHAIYQTVLGTDQSIFAPAVRVTSKDTDEPPYLAVSDNYMEFVRSGLISVSHGKLESLSGHDATISPRSEPQISDIAAVVLATGFEAASSISFLPRSIRETLSLQSSDLNNTVALAFHGTHHPDVPNLGFVGFYRSPYWGVMEMQARFIAALWNAGGPSSPSLPPAMASALAEDTSIQRTIALRSDPRASQFPMGDYPWLMKEFATALGLERSPPLGAMPMLPPAGKGMDILTPARYPPEAPNEIQQAEITKSLKQTEDAAWNGLTAGKFIARAVFRSFLGEWKLERDLVSKLPSHPSGHFSGIAKFLLREGTKDGRESEFNNDDDSDRGLEYLYIEEGDFKASTGFTFRATRRYVWRYNEPKDRLSVWFAKTDDQTKADYLFHNVEFKVPDQKQEDGWQATAGHLCIDDFYDVNYLFHFEGVSLLEWRLSYTVKGPKKDYTIDGVYSR